MSSAALTGKVELPYIKLGAYRFFAGPVGASIDEKEAFDTENPPAPFRDLGLANNESGMQLTVDMFDLKAGIPSMRKKKWVIGRDAVMNLTLEEFSPGNLARAIWQGQASFKTLVDSPSAPAIQEVAIDNTLGATLYELDGVPTSTVFDLLDVTGLNVGDRIVVEPLDADLEESDNRSYVTDITGDTVTVSPALPNGAPSAGDKLRVIISINGGDPTSNQITVTDGAEWTVDRFITLAQLEVDLPESPYEFQIISINGNVLTLDRPIGTTFEPEPFIAEVVSFKIPYGGGETCKLSLVAVYDDTGGGQMIVFMPRATCKGDLGQELYANAENLKFRMTVEADSHNMNLLDEDSIQEIQASPTPTATVFTVEDGTLLDVGDEIVVESAEYLLDNSVNKGVIESIDTDEITLTAPLSVAPEAGWVIKRVNSSVGNLVSMLHLQNAQ